MCAKLSQNFYFLSNFFFAFESKNRKIHKNLFFQQFNCHRNFTNLKCDTQTDDGFRIEENDTQMFETQRQNC